MSVSTISQLTGKTAIERAVKGLGLNDDLAGYLKVLIPVERGQAWSLHDCIHGNAKEKRKPVLEFINEVNKYEHLLECILEFENLVINRGIHASGVIITNTPYTDTISSIRSPKGVLSTCYDLHDIEYCGVVKVDLLTIQAADKIAYTMQLLEEYGHIEKQGTLKDTYWKYLHPDIIEYDNEDMWKNINNIYSIFQFDTEVSVKALKEINPKSVMELSATNSLLRLQTTGEEQPLQTYARYKRDLSEWENDCKKFNLIDSEMNILRKYLSDSYMLADSQEKVMRLSMDNKVAGFGLKESNLLRKGIAKKSPEAREESRVQFYEEGEKLKTRKEFLNYIWNEVFGKSFGYSFSQVHSYAYSIIALQELNLNYFYPPIYWNCACLTVESNAFDNQDNSTNKNTNYGKMAKAIYKMKKHGTKISPPSINESKVSFTPIEKDNLIVFGLGGISGINNEIAKEIIDNRPFATFEEFCEYVNKTDDTLLKPAKVIKLIQAGCFDKMNENRIELAKDYIKQNISEKETLTLSNVKKYIEMGLKGIPDELIKAYTFKNYVLSKEYFYRKDEHFKTKKHYIVENKFARPYFETKLIDRLDEEKDYYYENDYLIVIDKSLDKGLKPEIDKLKEYLIKPEIVREYNDKIFKETYLNRVKNEDINKWSFNSTSFYHYGHHELENVDLEKYNLSNFNDLPAKPEFIERTRGKRTWHQYVLSKICGVVVDKNDNKHIIDLLTPDNEVVSVKFNAGQYGYYKKVLSEINDGEKEILDTSWLSRGELLIICGYRNGDTFRAKRYSNTIYQHTVTRITEVKDNGELVLQFEREEKDNEEL